MWPPWAFMHSFSLSTTMANDVQSVPHSAAEFVSCMFERRQFWAVQSSQTCAHHGHFNICQTMGPRFVILKNSFRYLSLVIVPLIISPLLFFLHSISLSISTFHRTCICHVLSHNKEQNASKP